MQVFGKLFFYVGLGVGLGGRTHPLLPLFREERGNPRERFKNFK